MLATFEHYESWGRPPEYDDKPYFPIYRSVNGGQTWSKFSELRDTQSEWGLRYQPNLFELPTDVGPWDAGTVLAGVNSIPNDLSETSLELYASEDHGKTWEYVSTIVTGGEARPAEDDPVWEPEFAISTDGDLVCYYSVERDGYWTQRLAHKASSNGGLTWESETIDVALEDRRPGMPVVQKLPNGSYMMACEIVVPGGEVHVRTSPDGLDWGDPSDPGTLVETNDGRQLWNGPSITWTPRGGPDGTVLVAAKTLRYGDGSQAPGSGRTLLTTTDLSGKGEWTPVSGPLWYDDEIDVEEQYPDAESAAGVGWTTDLVVSENGKQLLSITSTYASEVDLCEIRYAKRPLPLKDV
ncbi:sialidase family protein [Haladaptatus salinisoli]|uniref:sialidase family protein n=1 Tax=Haladaptatus salinisoli TaxID=2884876 RepID=UPI001D0B71A8|nr:sialidase family protein [Haladaptatus salinisoli]